MAEVSINEVPKKTQDMFNKGLGALERGNLDYAIDLFMQCLELEPALLQARKMLRAAEVRKIKQQGSGLARKMAVVKGIPTYLKAMTALKGEKPQQAMLQAEKLLREDPLNKKFVTLFADAAVAAGLPEAAIHTLETARDQMPHDVDLLNHLGSIYLEEGRTRDARACFERIVEISPNDPDAVKLLKDAMALDSLASDGWQAAASGGSYRDIIKDEGEAVRLEQEAKAVKTERDADALIEDTKQKIEAEPENMNYYRALARLYAQKQDFDNALATLDKALELSPGDPELDSAHSSVKVQQFDHQIAGAREAGDEETAAALEAERDQFIYDDLEARVKRYPNDLKLRFDLGVILHDNGYLNEAIQQFQRSQRSPKHRIRSLYYLALSFRKKGQLDLALEQLKEADSELATMDNQKKEVCYQIGEVAEEIGDLDTAAQYYKKVYQSDIGYKDIADKIERLYEQRRAQEGEPS